MKECKCITDFTDFKSNIFEANNKYTYDTYYRYLNDKNVKQYLVICDKYSNPTYLNSETFKQYITNVKYERKKKLQRLKKIYGSTY